MANSPHVRRFIQGRFIYYLCRHFRRITKQERSNEEERKVNKRVMTERHAHTQLETHEQEEEEDAGEREREMFLIKTR